MQKNDVMLHTHEAVRLLGDSLPGGEKTDRELIESEL